MVKGLLKGLKAYQKGRKATRRVRWSEQRAPHFSVTGRYCTLVLQVGAPHPLHAQGTYSSVNVVGCPAISGAIFFCLPIGHSGKDLYIL